MGGFQSNSRPSRTGSATARWLLAGLLLAGSTVPGQASDLPIGTPSLPAAGAARAVDGAEPPDARVAASPEPDASLAPAPSGPSARANAAEEPPPLTRAAARRRVETISPMPWLVRFGPVSLERRE